MIGWLLMKILLNYILVQCGLTTLSKETEGVERIYTNFPQTYVPPLLHQSTLNPSKDSKLHRSC